MTLPGKQKIESFIFKLAAAAGAIVLSFSIFHQYHFFMIILRTVMSFSLIFFLGKGLLRLWTMISPPPVREEKDYKPTIDIILGDLYAKGGSESSLLPKELSDNAQESINKSEIEPIAAGKYEGAVPGQISVDMKNGLKDASAKAEIVRRMGLSE
jgi:hypothetical protein